MTGEGLIISAITTEDKESLLPETEKPKTKSASFDIPTHFVAQTIETTTTDNVGEFKREEIHVATAITDHITFRSVITSETATGDLEKPMEDFIQPEKKMIDVSFQEEEGITVIETIASDKEKEYFKKLEMQGEQATASFDAHKVAQLTEINPASISGDLTMLAPITVAAKEERLPLKALFKQKPLCLKLKRNLRINL